MARKLPKQDDAYWKKRIKQEQKYMEQATNIPELKKYYQQAVDEIQEKIDAEYARLDKLGFSSKDVKQADIRRYEQEAKEVVAQADKIREELGRNAKRSDFTDAVNDRMTIYNATMRINRLEYLKSRSALSLVKAGVNVIDKMTKEFFSKYIGEFKRQAGILGRTFQHMGADRIIKHVLAQTDGATFSDRVWKNTDELKARLDVLLTNNRIKGENPDKIARRLRDLVSDQFAGQAKYVTERIARTESTRLIGEAQKESYKKYGIKFVKWIAEASACDFCEDIAHGGKDGEGVYKIDNVPAYPRHP
ncbi:phage head morphogenesis protein [Ligilactobacillus pabuli]|uniref:Phage head morphogenesis protein n=1 Tax=Ligilactobacillus pabuli TaxID=2886039 RepID=A0ABQ5JF94_9LACO|nr:phage head morphogenesis protein [Ligilactobacillus pabuli]GKS80724.1 phage head morphogenesis protein [Ligilactobacillus pabuli]